MKISLKAARVNANLSQSDVADKLGKTRQTVASWEAGVSIPDAANMALLLNLYGVKETDIFFTHQVDKM